MRWRVYNQASGAANPFALWLDADNEQSAKKEWHRVIGLGEDDPDVDLDATPQCPKCEKADRVFWRDAWRNWVCGDCNDWF